MKRDASEAAARLIARARRPAVNPWSLLALREVEADDLPPVVSVGSPVDSPRRSKRLVNGMARTLESGAVAPVPVTAAGVTATMARARRARSSTRHAVEPAPLAVGENDEDGHRGPSQPWSSRPAAAQSADPSSGYPGGGPDGEVTAAPDSRRAPSHVPAEPNAEHPQVSRQSPQPAAAERWADVPALVADLPEVAAGQPATRLPGMRAVAAVAAHEPTAHVRAEPDASLAPPPSSGGAVLPSVVIDEIRIVTPPAASPAPDPLASLAAQRVGASRHRGGERWRA